MSRWTCPHCSSVWNVADTLSGKMQCPKCKRSSDLNSVDNGDVPKGRSFGAPQETQVLVAVNSSLTTVTLASVVIALVVIGSVGLAVLLLGGGPSGQAVAVQIIATAAVVLAVSGALFAGVNELHKCRKLLEIIARKHDE